MVASGQSPEQQPIAVPEQPTVQTDSDSEATLLVSIAADGQATLGAQPLAPTYPEMVEQFRKSDKAQREGNIAISAVGTVQYRRVIEVMAAAREAGIASVGLASERI